MFVNKRHFRSLAFCSLVLLICIISSLLIKTRNNQKENIKENKQAIRETLNKEQLSLSELDELIHDIKDNIQETLQLLDDSSIPSEQHKLTRRCLDLVFLYDQTLDKLPRKIVDLTVLVDIERTTQAANYLIDLSEKIPQSPHSISQEDRLAMLKPMGRRLYQLNFTLSSNGQKDEALRCLSMSKNIYKELVELKPTYSDECVFFNISVAECFSDNDYEVALKKVQSVLIQYQKSEWAFREAFYLSNRLDLELLPRYSYNALLVEVFEDSSDDSTLGKSYWSLSRDAISLGLREKSNQWLKVLLERIPDHPLAETARQLVNIDQTSVLTD